MDYEGAPRIDVGKCILKDDPILDGIHEHGPWISRVEWSYGRNGLSYVVLGGSGRGFNGSTVSKYAKLENEIRVSLTSWGDL